MVQSTHLFNIIFRVVDKASASLASIDRSLKRIAKGFDDNSKRIGGFNKQMLGLGLGMTFFMWGVQMQLQRMLRSMFNTFTLAEGETGALNQQFNIVRANLAAISIAFFDAFAQSGLFEIILNFVIKIADWFLNLSDEMRENIVVWSLIGVAALAVIGIAGQITLAIGTFALAWKYVFGSGGSLATDMAAGMGKKGVSGTTVGNFEAGFSLMKTLIGAGLVIKAMVDTYQNITDEKPTPFMDILKTAIMGGGGAGLLTWGAGAGLAAGGIVALATGAIIIAVMLNINQAKIRMQELNNALNKKIFSPELLTSENFGFGVSYQGTVLPKSAREERERIEGFSSSGGIDISGLSKAIIDSVKEGARLGIIEGGKIGIIPSNSTSG